MWEISNKISLVIKSSSHEFSGYFQFIYRERSESAAISGFLRQPIAFTPNPPASGVYLHGLAIMRRYESITGKKGGSNGAMAKEDVVKLVTELQALSSSTRTLKTVLYVALALLILLMGATAGLVYSVVKLNQDTDVASVSFFTPPPPSFLRSMDFQS